MCNTIYLSAALLPYPKIPTVPLGIALKVAFSFRFKHFEMYFLKNPVILYSLHFARVAFLHTFLNIANHYRSKILVFVVILLAGAFDTNRNALCYNF